MASTYSDLKFELIGTGDQAGTWGATTNTNLGTAIQQAITGTVDITFASADVTLTLTDTNAAQNARALRLNLTGTSGGARNLIVPAIAKQYIINNGTADVVTIKNSSGTGVAIPAGYSTVVFNNATNVVDIVNYLVSLSLGTPLPFASGGTAAASAPAAMAGLIGFTSTATAAGTTTLTNASSYYQVFTGSTTQTIVLPVTSTLATGWSFHIVNNSTGNLSVQSSGANALITVLPGTTAMCTCILTSGTTAASWEAGLTDFSTATGTGDVVLGTSPTVNNPTITNYVESVVAIGTVTTASTLSLTNGTVQTATLTASTACTFTMPTATAGKSFVLLLKQAASTGNGTATFTSVKWSGGTAPTITATAGKMDILTFVSDGTNWYGSFVQNYTP